MEKSLYAVAKEVEQEIIDSGYVALPSDMANHVRCKLSDKMPNLGRYPMCERNTVYIEQAGTIKVKVSRTTVTKYGRQAVTLAGLEIPEGFKDLTETMVKDRVIQKSRERESQKQAELEHNLEITKRLLDSGFTLQEIDKFARYYSANSFKISDQLLLDNY